MNPSSLVKSFASFGVVLLAASAGATAPSSLVANVRPESIVFRHTSHVRPFASTSSGGYTPAQIRHAYGLDKIGGDGSGQTIAIVVAYGSSTIQNDLAFFNATFGLPNSPIAVYYPQGKPATADSGWAAETSLDVEWSHVSAPGASIALVVAKSAGMTDLLGAVDYAVSLGAKQVSMSWGGSEFSSETYYDSHFKHAGVSFFASSGDSGSGASWPAGSPYVVGVGGTTLVLDSAGNVAVETGWSGSGGGVSRYEIRPAFQNGWQSNSRRSIPDVCYDADPNTGVYVYISNYNGRAGWLIAGGTSAAAPQWAGIFAVANSWRNTPIDSANTALYSIAGSSYVNDYDDPTTGSNGGFNSAPGYDYVTGLGSPKCDQLIPALASLR